MPNSESRHESASERILVIRFSSLGDILLTALAIRCLRSHVPHARIDLLVAAEYADAAEMIPGVDAVLTLDRRQGLAGLRRLRAQLHGRYAVVIDLQNSLRSAVLRASLGAPTQTKAKRYRFRRWLLVALKWNTYAEIRPVPLRYLAAMQELGVRDDLKGLELQVPSSATLWAAHWWQSCAGDGRKVIMLCPGARHFTKRWPHERWIDAARTLSARGFALIVVGTESELAVAQAISAAVPGTPYLTDRPIPDIAALMRQCSAVVSNDSGLMHVATGVGTPVAAIFGPTVEEFGFYPFRGRSAVLSHDLPCRPCSAMGGPRCPQKHFHCMLNTLPDMVESAVEHLVS
jgi:lipopolysaccharide heptosyltransferase II